MPKQQSIDPINELATTIIPSSFVNPYQKEIVMNSLKDYKQEVQKYVKKTSTIVVESDETYDYLRAEIKFCDDTEKKIEKAINDINSADPDISTALEILTEIKQDYRACRLAITKTNKEAKHTMINTYAEKAKELGKTAFEETITDLLSELGEEIKYSDTKDLDYITQALSSAVKGKFDLDTLKEVPKGVRKINKLKESFNEYLIETFTFMEEIAAELKTKCLITIDLSNQKVINKLPNITTHILEDSPIEYKKYVEEQLEALKEALIEDDMKNKSSNLLTEETPREEPKKPVKSKTVKRPKNLSKAKTDTITKIYSLSVEIVTDGCIEDIVAEIKDQYPCITNVSWDTDE